MRNKALMFLVTMLLIIAAASNLVYADSLSCLSSTLTTAAAADRVQRITTNATSNPPNQFWVYDYTDEFLYHLNSTAGNLNAPPGNCSTTAQSGAVQGLWTNASGGAVKDFWALYDTYGKLIHYNSTCSFSADTRGNFTVTGIGVDDVNGLWSNASNRTPTDFWIGDITNMRIRHYNATGTAVNDSTFNCSIMHITNTTDMSLWSNDTNTTPKNMWIFASDDYAIYHINSTCGLLDTINLSVWSIGYSSGMTGIPLGAGSTHLYISSQDDDKIYTFSNRVLLGNTSWSYAAVDNSVNDNISLSLTGTGASLVSVCMPQLTVGEGFNCSYNLSGAVNLTLTNNSLGCWVNGTFTGATGSVSSRVQYYTPISFEGVGNLPAAIVGTAVVGIVVIWSVVTKRRRQGYT